MSWIIDDFSVRNRGDETRVKLVLVDENGNITNANKPGKAAMNLSCTTDYRFVNRRFNENDIITEFANFTTFTWYIVKAQDCAPFAYVETELNSPKAGYETPLPEPAVPPNPFGTAFYGLYKTYYDCDIDGRPFNVTIKKRAYFGDDSEINQGGSRPVKINYKSEENKFAPIRSSELILNFISEIDYEFEELYTDDERMFRVDVAYDDGEKIYSGFLVPDTAREPFSEPPYNVTLRVADGLGALKNITYPFPIGSKVDIRQSFKDILCFCLSGTSLNLDLRTVSNLYEVKMPNGMNDDPLALATVNPVRMSDSKSTPYNCYDVLEHLCTLFGAYITQSGGVWQFVRVNELSYASARARIYNYKGLFLRAEYLENLRIAGKDKDVILINGGHEITVGFAYKRVLVLQKYGDTPANIFNGDFSMWDGQNFNGWTRYGGFNFTRYQKSIKTTAGQSVLIEDYAMLFNETASSGKWMELAAIDVVAGDKITLSFNQSTLNPTQFPKALDKIALQVYKVRIKVGSFYLYNEFYPGDNFIYVTNPTYNQFRIGDSFSWVSELATCSIVKDEFTPGKATISMPEIPVSGPMVIQFYGVETWYYSQMLEGFYRRLKKDPFVKSWIDDVQVGVTRKNSEDKPQVGILSYSENYASYYNSPDQIETIYGDLDGSYKPLNENKLHVIYTADGSPSTAWNEYGQGGNAQNINLFLAKSILKAYQRPFRYFSGDFRGDNLNYLNVFNIDKLEGRTFAFQGGEFDIKHKEVNGASLVEIFAKSLISNDASIPFNEGDIPPPIVQNPNGVVMCTSDEVFSCVFTDEFGIGAPQPEPIELAPGLTSYAACGLYEFGSDTYYLLSDLEIGTVIYSDSGATTPAIDKWYSEGNYAYRMLNGSISQIVQCVLPPGPIAIHLWAKLTTTQVMETSSTIYANLTVKIYQGTSGVTPPSFVDGNLYNYTGTVVLVRENDVNSRLNFNFSNQNTLTIFNQRVVTKFFNGTQIESYFKIDGTADRNTPKYLGFITI